MMQITTLRRVRLRPFAQGEIEGAKAQFIERIIDNDFSTPDTNFTKEEFLQRALIGRYPEALSFNHRERRRWHRDYIEAILSRVLQDVTEIRKHDSMKKLISVTAVWSSKFLDVSAIRSGLGIQRPTLENYLQALQTLFLVDRLPAWTATDYARVGKRDKLFMTDPGLMASLLRYPENVSDFTDD